ncbi:MAG: hypothetical protein AB7O86_05700 [Porticoccaceae bacterium]
MTEPWHPHPYGDDGLSINDPFEMSMYDGTMINPFTITPEQVNIKHIARGLSRIIRYNGQIEGVYTVAEHSVRVAGHIHVYGGRSTTLQVTLWMQGLLHDAAEYVLSDIIRPMKRRPEFAFFREVDDYVTAVVMRRFELPEKLHELVHEADNAVLHQELAARHRGECPGRWTADEAEREFLALFNTISRLRGMRT